MPRTPEAKQKGRKTVGPMACRHIASAIRALEGSVEILRLELKEQGRNCDGDFNLIDMDVRNLRRWLPVVECCVDENSPLDPLEVQHEAVYGEKCRAEDTCRVDPANLIPRAEARFL